MISPLAAPAAQPTIDDMTATNRVLEAALEYAAKGLAVFPINPATKVPDWRLVPPKKDETGKKISSTGGVKKATKDFETIRVWWARFPNNNVGIALGEPSGGVVAFDVDGPNEEQILNDCGLGGISSSLEAKSGRADGTGRHIFFKASGDGLRNRSINGGGIRATGYYVVAPPSVHKS